MQPEQSEPQSSWQFVPETNNPDVSAATQPSASSPVSWSASEFIAYHKNAGWYLLALLVVAVIAGGVFLITGDVISVVSIVVLGILFLVFASRKPRVLQYSVDDKGVTVGQKLYAFKELRSFAVIDEGAMHSISLYPLKRFMPPVSIYYEPQDEASIVDLLGNFLPKEDKNQDMVDRLMHKIRF